MMSRDSLFRYIFSLIIYDYIELRIWGKFMLFLLEVPYDSRMELEAYA